MGQTPNNFTINKSITIILVHVSQLKKNLSYFSLLSHTHKLIISFKVSNTLLSSLWLFFRRWLYFTLSLLLRSSQAKNLFLSLASRSIFPLPIVKAIKFFVVLSIYKTLLLFSLGLGIHYLFNQESILSWIRNTLPL